MKPVTRLIVAAALLTSYCWWLSPTAAPPVSAAPLAGAAAIRSDIEASGAAFSAGRYDEALAPTQRLTEAMPTQAMYFGRLATIQLHLGKRADEARSLEAMFAVSPTPWDACPALPQAYDASGDAARALNAFERCVEVDPENPDALLFLGRAYNGAGRAADARRVLEKAIALAPEYPDLHLILGVRSFADERLDEARRSFERFVELAPDRREEASVWLQRTEGLPR